MNTTTMMFPFLAIPLSAFGAMSQLNDAPQPAPVHTEQTHAPKFEDAPVAEGNQDELLDRLNAAQQHKPNTHSVPPFFSRQVRKASGKNQ